jgi:hypothetical protein
LAELRLCVIDEPVDFKLPPAVHRLVARDREPVELNEVGSLALDDEPENVFVETPRGLNVVDIGDDEAEAGFHLHACPPLARSCRMLGTPRDNGLSGSGEPAPLALDDLSERKVSARLVALLGDRGRADPVHTKGADVAAEPAIRHNQPHALDQYEA